MSANRNSNFTIGLSFWLLAGVAIVAAAALAGTGYKSEAWLALLAGWLFWFLSKVTK